VSRLQASGMAVLAGRCHGPQARAGTAVAAAALHRGLLRSHTHQLQQLTGLLRGWARTRFIGHPAVLGWRHTVRVWLCRDGLPTVAVAAGLLHAAAAPRRPQAPSHGGRGMGRQPGSCGSSCKQQPGTRSTCSRSGSSCNSKHFRLRLPLRHWQRAWQR
jgi:hypothetical protein